jgi:hypothetical protein
VRVYNGCGSVDSTTATVTVSVPDSKLDKAGVFRAGLWILDANGNGIWDPTAGDRAFHLGQAGDIPVAGDWNGDGRSEAGVFRSSEGLWVVDYNGNGVWDGPDVDRAFILGQSGDQPVVADWNGDGRAKAGIFRPSQGLWVLDYNGNGRWDGTVSDRGFPLGQSGDQPIVGDWNGDGRDKAAVFRPSSGLWVLDYNGNALWDGPLADRAFSLGQNGDRAVAGDWNGDGRDKAGVFRSSQGLWVLDYNRNARWDGTDLDRASFLGQNGDQGVVGDWNGDGRAKAGVFRPAHGLWVLDTDGNGAWDPSRGDRAFHLGQAGDAATIVR